MIDRFNKFFDYLLFIEGNYSNHPDDKGGETKYGITKETAGSYGYKGEMTDLTKALAQKIYEKKYYKAYKIDKIKNDKMDLSIFDFVVNSGKYGIKKAQEAVNKVYGKNVLIADGIIGLQTVKYLNLVNSEKFLAEYHKLQIEYYNAVVKSNPKQKVFLAGWLNRVKRKENYLKNV